MTNDVPDRDWPDQVWLEDEFGYGHEDQFQYGCWDCRNVYEYNTLYLRATPPRLHAEELVGALRVIVESWDWWQVDTYDRDQSVPGDAVYDARALLARIEQETTHGKEQAND